MPHRNCLQHDSDAENLLSEYVDKKSQSANLKRGKNT